jgi:amino acid adenylation domain-containing protein
LDGWSLATVVAEIFQDYVALRDGVERVSAAPAIAYRDFVALEQQTINSQATRRFWTEKINDITVNRLPRWHDLEQSGAHEQKRGPELHIEPSVLQGLKALAQAAGVPLKSVLLAAHQRVMALLYGQTDVTTGLICNGRPELRDGEKLVGLFLNTLPLRQTLKGGTWLDLVNQTFLAEQELLPHRRFPLAEIQKLGGGQQLFETAFDFVHFHVLKALDGLPDLAVAESHYFEANNLATYTTFMLDVLASRLELHIDYDPNLICRRQIEQITAYYVETLRALAHNPHAAYETFSPLPAPERRQLLVEWNATAEDYPQDKPIHRLFEERALENPNAPALTFAGQTLTYGALNARADSIAAQLGAFGLAPEELVAICVDRSPEMVLGLLGILKAGGAYVPLDPAYPKERLSYMLADANPRLVLTQDSLRASLPDTSATILSLDAMLSVQQVCAAPNTAPGVAASTSLPTSPEAGKGRGAGNCADQVDLNSHGSPLAYVIYTSGSTGKPKGVQVSHRSVVNVLTSIARKTTFNAKDNLLAVTTLSFDIAALELFLPLITGGRLTLASREVAAEGTQLARLIDSCGATAMQGTPATWRLLIESGWQGKPDLKIFCGGEALKAQLADQLLQRGAEVWNFYGPTETTIWSTAWKVSNTRPISIGRPLGNTEVFILDSHLQPVPVGTVGELFIAGAGLARGYLGLPELTAERFVDNPFAAASSGRMYKTGDLARFLPDGRIECLGRLDHQVKVRGFRIELAEVETVLRRHPTITDALVIAREDSFGEKRLVSYVISRNGPPPTSELRDFVQTRLPLYMVPAHYVLLKQFPLMPNGKIDLHRLPAPENTAQPGKPYVAPRTPEEQQLSQIWHEVLELSRIGIDDNFFELGGDSLSATRTFARINRTFGLAMTLREILEHPTLRLLAELIAKNKGRAPAACSPIPRRPRRTAQHPWGKARY